MNDCRILVGDALAALGKVEDGTVQCCVTSPPYFGLRDYGHKGQLGLEKTPEEYVEKMVEVFREVRRVLRDDGTVWLNVGDTYARNPKKGQHKPGDPGKQSYIYDNGGGRASSTVSGDIPEKNIIGTPWMLAFALRADGWYLRQDIIWHKPNPMPESVRDRCTKAHEYLFLLTKNAKYFYDVDAVKEPVAESSKSRLAQKNLAGQAGSDRVPFKTNGPMKAVGNAETRNKRSVWTVTTRPFKGAHFATFPPDLIRPCILAGSKPGDLVLDPFLGSGTTAMVALEEGRAAVGGELNPEYLPLIRERVRPFSPEPEIIFIDNSDKPTILQDTMLEQAIDNLTTALEANTAAILAAAGGVAAVTPEPAKPAKKAAKKKAQPKVKKPEPEPEPEATPVEEEEEFDRDAVLTEITEFVRNAIIAAGEEDPDRSDEVKEKFMEFRAGFGIELASDLPDDKLQEFLDGVKELLG